MASVVGISTPVIRLAIGLLQGVALLMLYQASEHKTWPATDGLVFAPLATIATFVPLIVISALGHLRLRTLAAWAVVATLLCAGLATYDIFRNSVSVVGISVVTTGLMPILPSWVMWWSLASILFIIHTLTISGEADRKLIASYPTHFDIAWKHGVQFVLAVGFVSLFWGLLFLGAELFRLIKIEFLAELIKRTTFSIPVTALAFSYAIHVTDVRANIVQGARTLALILLSWLLPLMALLGAAFVVALLFTGLTPLWSTRRAASILLVAAAALVFLVNAAYQDGRAETRAVAILRYASRLAAFVLVPLVALAAYGVMLRIAQYGWTPERITALACVIVAACYGLGYLFAALRSTTSMAWLEPTNIFTSLAIVGVLLALSTPVADPARISVADQLSRLQAGTEKPEHFDFGFLRYRAGRYGVQALEQLAARTEGPQASVIAERANQALHAKSPWELARAAAQPPTTPAQRGLHITVIFPIGATLPEGFVQQDWNAFQPRWKLPNCLVSDTPCDAILTDLDGDGQPEVQLFDRPGGVAAAFKKGLTEGTWSYLGAVLNANCSGVRDAIHAGHFETAQPTLKEITANGQRLYIGTDCVRAP
ncbi:protein of unknown function [Bradyrhizobium lablabi]|uniref:DUF4153 domain-containing protein n=1 Tax=Bradyrhizobium lablabi TaxID=722472 RepID=A0A1M6KIK4_9BRAD|nr:DUF4153 domain-containing protein [Bradyrhizobium lablabi]SHJ58788.1 protein of unknown function [Bradyrhizobium lablabi]